MFYLFLSFRADIVSFYKGGVTIHYAKGIFSYSIPAKSHALGKIRIFYYNITASLLLIGDGFDKNNLNENKA